MKITKQMCKKLELFGSVHLDWDEEPVGYFYCFPGYPEIYYDLADFKWYDNTAQVVDWEDNHFDTLWELIEAIDEIRSRRV